MTYAIKEIFKTLQGEGSFTGHAAVFCRFAGCNLWSGREKDRPTAVCKFCDTDFVGGTKYRGRDLAEAIAEAWGPERKHRLVVLTGGEPLLQVDTALLDDLHGRDFFVAVETNGTQPIPEGIDWVVVSPKAGAPLRVTGGHELKLPYPQPGAMPEHFTHLLQFFRFARLQPIDGPQIKENTEAAIAYCLANPQWRLSVQMHKLIGVL